MTALEARSLRFRYPGVDRPAVDGVSLTVPAGSFCALLGPNGSGKSTLLRLLVGVLRPEAGEALYFGKPIGEWSRREVACRIGAVPQVEELAFPLRVAEYVAMGRYPHLGTWRAERPADREAVQAALEHCDVRGFADRPLPSLSGGERQRVRIARALAQIGVPEGRPAAGLEEPGTLVLDEPTASLDIRHEMEILELLARLVAEGVTVLAVTHNLNLAARYAGQLLLLDAGRAAARGAPGEVLTRAAVETVYRWPVNLAAHPGPGPDRGAPQVVPLADPRRQP